MKDLLRVELKVFEPERIFSNDVAAFVMGLSDKVLFFPI